MTKRDYQHMRCERERERKRESEKKKYYITERHACVICELKMDYARACVCLCVYAGVRNKFRNVFIRKVNITMEISSISMVFFLGTSRVYCKGYGIYLIDSHIL